VAYRSRGAILQVTFRNGTAYQYAGVPRQTYQDLLQAESKGAYFNHYIRGLYTYQVLHGEKPAASN
jgi:hypothetical protein